VQGPNALRELVAEPAPDREIARRNLKRCNSRFDGKSVVEYRDQFVERRASSAGTSVGRVIARAAGRIAGAQTSAAFEPRTEHAILPDARRHSFEQL
jgi:hypothetical protein